MLFAMTASAEPIVVQRYWNLVDLLIRWLDLTGTASALMHLCGALICIIVPYLLGSINPAILISKTVYHEDIRDFGSGNAGTTNMLRTYGKKAAIATLLCDLGKAAVAVLLALAGTAGDIAAFFRELGSRSGIPRELLVPLYKTVGIALVVKIGGGLCADAGEKALTAVVETAGAVCALGAALPLLEAAREPSAASCVPESALTVTVRLPSGAGSTAMDRTNRQLSISCPPPQPESVRHSAVSIRQSAAFFMRLSPFPCMASGRVCRAA